MKWKSRLTIPAAVMSVVLICAAIAASGHLRHGLLSSAGAGNSAPVTRESAVSQTLAGLDRDDFADLSVEDPPGQATTSATNWVYGSLLSPIDGYESTWEADLAVGAIAKRLATGDQRATTDVVGGASISIASDSNQASLKVPVNIGPAPLDQQFSIGVDTSADAVKSNVETILSSLGYSQPNVRILFPYGPAVFVSLVVDPSSLTDHPVDPLSTEVAIGGSYGAHTVEGVMVEYHAPDGTLMAAAYTASRLYTGGEWINPNFSNDFTSNHG